MSTSTPKRVGTKPRRVLLGVTGGIAVYKSCLLLRRLVDAGHEVRVVMTQNATRFVAPLTFSTLSGHDVPQDPFRTDAARGTEHIDYSLWAEDFVIAPATANILGKAANGIADDFLSTLICAFDRPILFAPAMNHRMWSNPAVQRNIEQLRADGHLFVEPGSGYLACGETGAGRMAEPEQIHEALDARIFGGTGLQGRKVLVSAGPTVEDLDEVRFLSNRSSGKMGYALARAAAWLGAEVCLVSGPTLLPDPLGLRTIRVRSAAEMAEVLSREHERCDVLVMAAAVADYAPAFQPGKLKKQPGDLDLKLSRTTDILATLAERKGHRLHVGFALEHRQGEAAARDKLERKRLDMICLNHISDEDGAFASEHNRLTLLLPDGGGESLPRNSKQMLALEVMRRIAGMAGR